MRHRRLKQTPQLFPLLLQLGLQTRRQHEHSRLRNGTLDQRVNVTLVKAELLEALWLIAEIGEELGEGIGEHGAGVLALDVGDVDAEALGGLEVALGVGGGGEAEDGGGRDGDGDAVGDDGAVDLVTPVPVARVLARDGVRHAVAEVDAGVAEPDAREGRGEEHLALGLVVLGVPDGAREVLDRGAQGVEGEDVADGVGALVRGPQDGVGGPRRPGVEGDGGPGLERVAEHVETGRGLHGGGHGARVEWVADAQRRLEVAVGDARLGPLGHQVKDGGARRLGPRAGCGRDGDQGLELPLNGQAAAQRRVDKVEKVGLRVGGVQVHQLGRVNDGATTDAEECVRLVGFGELNGLFDAI